jgi:uncharacterized RDD family membrane protein YckC
MQNSKSLVATPTLKRRLICLVYEAFLLTAVLMFGFLFYSFASGLMSEHTKLVVSQIVLFAVAGVYFVTSWTGSGHTLAMKTWRIKLVKVGYAKVPMKAALVRYVCAWGWLLPALAVCFAFGLKGKAMAAALAVGVVAWALTAFLDKDRQFLHDKLAGTRLISLPKPVKAGKIVNKPAS